MAKNDPAPEAEPAADTPEFEESAAVVTVEEQRLADHADHVVEKVNGVVQAVHDRLGELDKKLHGIASGKEQALPENILDRVAELEQHVKVIRSWAERAIGHKVPDIADSHLANPAVGAGGAETAASVTGEEPAAA